MKEKKNIERLFQEKFKHFEVTPPTNAWENISKELHPEKKKRSLIPFWLRISGIAATLLLGTFLLKNIFNSEQPDQITKTDTIEIPVLDSDKNQNTETSGSQIQERIVTENTTIQIVEAIQKIDQNSDSSLNSSQKSSSNSESDLNTIILSPEQKTTSTLASENRKDNKSQVLDNYKESNFTDITKQKDNNSNSDDKQLESNTKLPILEQSDEELLAESKSVEQELEEFKKLTEDKSDENQTETIALNRWKITPNIAPITMNSITEGSSLSDSFIENPKENVTTLSYGMAFSYAFNKKFNIRTGLNRVSVGYNTNNVEIYATTNIKDVLSHAVNINFNKTSENIVVRPENTFTTQNDFSPSTGKINQQIGFIEVPVELSYKILDSRFGIELIGGMSTLFLNENEISVISQGMSIVLGEADNLNDVHFSTNLGVGFRYQIFQSFEASLEPMFKYQLGTFSKNDGNFKPYILGLYTGLSFKF